MRLLYRGNIVELEICDRRHRTMYGSFNGDLQRIDHQYLQGGLKKLVKGREKNKDRRVYILI